LYGFILFSDNRWASGTTNLRKIRDTVHRRDVLQSVRK